MGLFDKLFSKKDVPAVADSAVVAPVTGEMVSASELSDAVFAQELLGQTIGVVPADNVVVAPANGTIEVVFETGHAFGIKTNDGVGLLVHIGVDTVSLNGKGFKVFAKQGDKVKAGQKIVEADFAAIKEAGLDPTVMLIVTEQPTEDFKVNYIANTDVENGQVINQ